MKIGLVKEIKQDEYRVGLTPSSALGYVAAGHTVYVEKDAGVGSAFADSDYEAVGCEIIADKAELFDKSEMLIKVKEPLEEEFQYFHEGQILYTYLHLAAAENLTKFLLEKKIAGCAYETVTAEDGSLPLLKPMSEIAGRLSIQEGAKYLEKYYGGRGILLGGVPGIRRGKVAILGGGVVGINACKMAVGLGADVTILDVSSKRLTYLDDIFGSTITTLYSNEANIQECLRESDLVIGAVLIPGAAAPKLVRREHFASMKNGAVIVDVAVDQGGCFETTKPTYHHDPTFIIDDIVHYCVANMPGAVAISSTMALTSVTNPYGLEIANKGIEDAIASSHAIATGMNTYKGKLTNKGVGEAHGLDYEELGI